MDAEEINEFLSYLAVKKKVSASTQTQALCAVLFMYKHVIDREISGVGNIARARRPKRLPVVLTRQEARSVLSQLNGQYRLMAAVMYGAGLRLMECIRLRVKDIDFSVNQITVRDGKGAKGRVTMLPQSTVGVKFEV